MTSIASFERGLKLIRREWRKGSFERALERVNDLLEKWPDNPQLLTMQGNLIQLQSSDTGPTLEDAKAVLERAAGLDEESPAAWLELGFFLSAVEDDAQGAHECFQKAIGLCQRFLTDALFADGQAVFELGDRQGALARLAGALELHSKNGSRAGKASRADILERLGEVARAE